MCVVIRALVTAALLLLCACQSNIPREFDYSGGQNQMQCSSQWNRFYQCQNEWKKRVAAGGQPPYTCVTPTCTR